MVIPVQVAGLAWQFFPSIATPGEEEIPWYKTPPFFWSVVIFTSCVQIIFISTTCVRGAEWVDEIYFPLRDGSGDGRCNLCCVEVYGDEALKGSYESVKDGERREHEGAAARSGAVGESKTGDVQIYVL